MGGGGTREAVSGAAEGGDVAAVGQARIRPRQRAHADGTGGYSVDTHKGSALRRHQDRFVSSIANKIK